MRLFRTAQSVLLCAISALSSMAQTGISIGVKGGIPLTNSFADRTFSYDIAVRSPFSPSFSQIPQAMRVYSGSRYFILGPTVELQLPFGFGIEADALYRPMEVQTQQTTSLANFLLGSGLSPIFSTRLDSWEFPILAKYRVPLSRVRPYVDAGPTFRAVSASLAEHISGTGISAGIGLESRIGRLRLSPEIRYTHWGTDGTYSAPYHAVSYPNQVEFLVGLATSPATAGSSQRAHTGLLNHLSIGVKGGFPFTDAFMLDQFEKLTTLSVRCGGFGPTTDCLSVTPSIQTFRTPRNYLIGPMLEVRFSRNVSIEGDMLYGPLSIAAVAPPLLVLPSPLSIKTFDSWQFPVLGKYKFSAPFLSPYFEAGPTFRTASSPLNDYLAAAGVTAGLGVEGSLWRIRIAPEVRFVHWGADSPNAAPFYTSRRNQAQFLLGLSY